MALSSILDSDTWINLKQKIKDERAIRLEGLMHATPQTIGGLQQYINALDWVLDQSEPKPEPQERDIYDDDEDD
jgi:hypothetical protein